MKPPLKSALLFLCGLCLLVSCSNSRRVELARQSPTSLAVPIQESANVEPARIQTANGPATGGTNLPLTNQPREDIFILSPLVIQGVFEMSFGIGVKILRDGLSDKVLIMFVDAVDPDSDAAKKGLQVGTRIIAIDGKPVSEIEATFVNGSELNLIFYDRKLGAKVRLEVVPIGSQKTKVITIIQKPNNFDADNWVIQRMK